MKAFTIFVALMVVLLIGYIIGLVMGDIVDGEAEVRCFDGEVILQTDAVNRSIVGEAIICGRDWHISNIYGPTLDDWDGPIEFEAFRREADESN